MPRDKLTELQQRFTAEYVKDWNRTAALRRAGSKASDAALAVTVCKWLKRDNVQEAIAKRTSELTRRSGVTAESYLQDCQELRDEAREAKQFSAAIKAQELIGRCTGYLIATKTPGDPADLAKSLAAVQVNISVEAPRPPDAVLPLNVTAIEVGTEFNRPITGKPGTVLSPSNDDGSYRIPNADFEEE